MKSWGSAFPEIVHLGGENCVTGSCHLLQANGMNILVDCGLSQGRDSALPMSSWPVKPSQVNFLFLTHAHIDHIGRVPELIEGGLRGEIIAMKGFGSPDVGLEDSGAGHLAQVGGQVLK